MKTILYNSEDNTVIGHYLDGYRVDGKPEKVEPPVYELTVVPCEAPDYDRATESIAPGWLPDIVSLTYNQVWVINKLTPEEIAKRDWLHPDFELRIVAPIELAMSDLGAKIYTWFSINSLPVEKVGNEVHLYCNEVLPEHTAILTEMQITPQQTPYKGYLLNLASGEIHRLANETVTCNIAQIVESESLSLKQALELIEAGKADGCAHCFAEQSKINKP